METINDPRRKTRRALIGLGIGLLLIPPAMLLAFFSAGGGHGDYLWARVFFPYTMLPSCLDNRAIGNMSIALAFLQFPVYGVLIGALAPTRKHATIVAGAIGVIHVAAVALCLASGSKYFS